MTNKPSRASKATIHLSISGHDSTGDGSKVRPVASLERAVSLSRETGQSRRRISVGDGIYFDTGVTLVAQDSGLEIVAAAGAKPVFLGGVAVSSWRPEDGCSSLWVADLSVYPDLPPDLRTLVVNDRMAKRARFPETGEILHASEFAVKWMSSTKGGWERPPTEEELLTLRIRPNSVPGDLSIENAELTIFHAWDDSMVGVRHWDREAGIMTFSTPAGHPPGSFGWNDKMRSFVIWNVREGLTQPGQWYHDRARKRLVYWPLPNERIEELTVFAPTQTAVLRLNGTEEAPVSDIRLKGLTFGLTHTPLRAGGFGAVGFEGAIEGEHAHGLRLEQVTVRWAGGQGVRVYRSDNVRCSHCTVYDVGAGGIILSGDHGLVRESLIHHNGRIYPAALALRVVGHDWQVHHNTLHHTPYTAINATGSNLRFEHNRFHHVMEELVDGAAIYIFAGKSCRIRGNYTYAMRSEQVHAYYLDERSEDCVVEDNISVGVYWPLHNHMASNCILRRNVLLNDGSMVISLAHCAGFSLRQNVFACGGELSFRTACRGIHGFYKNALFSSLGRYNWSFENRLPSLETESGPIPVLLAGKDSLFADSGCCCEDGKVTYGNEALARQQGLRPLDLSNAGCT